MRKNVLANLHADIAHELATIGRMLEARGYGSFEVLIATGGGVSLRGNPYSKGIGFGGPAHGTQFFAWHHERGASHRNDVRFLKMSSRELHVASQHVSTLVTKCLEPIDDALMREPSLTLRDLKRATAILENEQYREMGFLSNNPVESRSADTEPLADDSAIGHDSSVGSRGRTRTGTPEESGF